MLEPIILASARRHGVADEDILHAYRNPMRTEKEDELTMIVGPARDATLLELGVVAAEHFDNLLIVHAMTARPKYLR